MEVIVLVWEDSFWIINEDLEICCKQLYLYSSVKQLNSDTKRLNYCGYSVVVRNKYKERVIAKFMVEDMSLDEAKEKAECLVQYILQDLEQWDCVVGESNRMKVLRIPDLLDEFNENF